MRVCATAACWLLVACAPSETAPSPILGSVTPERGPAGAVVTLYGEFFCGQVPDAAAHVCDLTGAVQFGATPSIASTWTDSQILVEVPSGVRGEVSVRVMVAGRRSNELDFVVD